MASILSCHLWGDRPEVDATRQSITGQGVVTQMKHFVRRLLPYTPAQSKKHLKINNLTSQSDT